MYHTTVSPRTPGHRTRDCQDQGLEEIRPDYHVQRDFLVLLLFFFFLLAATLLLSLLSKIASSSSRTALRRFFSLEKRAPRPSTNSASRSACSLVKSASSWSSCLHLLLLLLFLLLQGAVQEEGQSCGIESFVGCELRCGQLRSSQRGAAHSAVAPLRPGHHRHRCRPHPRRQGRRCPQARVRLEPCLLPASSLLLSP